jgi:hypothetical protein
VGSSNNNKTISEISSLSRVFPHQTFIFISDRTVRGLELQPITTLDQLVSRDNNNFYLARWVLTIKCVSLHKEFKLFYFNELCISFPWVVFQIIIKPQPILDENTKWIFLNIFLMTLKAIFLKKNNKNKYYWSINRSCVSFIKLNKKTQIFLIYFRYVLDAFWIKNMETNIYGNKIFKSLLVDCFQEYIFFF